MDVAVAGYVGEIEPVAVAALGNGNDVVDLIDAVDAGGAFARGSNRSTRKLCARPMFPLAPRTAPFTASATPTASFPLTSAATIREAITRTTTNTATIA